MKNNSKTLEDKSIIIEKYFKSFKDIENKILFSDPQLPISEKSKEILRINYKKTRYIYDLYTENKINKSTLLHFSNLNLIDRELILLWNREGTRNICCIQCLKEHSLKGHSCVCRVPKNLQIKKFTECHWCGCNGCSDKLNSQN